MTKTELVKLLSMKQQVTTQEASDWADAFLSLIKVCLEDGNEVKLAGFGTFEVRTRAGGVRRNPRNGEKVEVGERKTVGFRPSIQLKTLLNEGDG